MLAYFICGIPCGHERMQVIVSVQRSELLCFIFICVVTKLIYSDTNCCVHNSRYHTYYNTNSWEIWGSPPTTSSTLWDRLPRARKMNIKRYKKKNTQFNVVRPKLSLYPRGETWESCINKLGTKRSNIPLDDTRVFAFLLNLCLDYKNIPSL